MHRQRSSALEKLGINWGLLIAQMFNVIFLVWMLSRFLYTPLINLLSERTKRVEESLQEADKVREQMSAQRKENEVELAKARQEAAAVMAQAQERARVQEQEIINQARAEAERIKADARSSAELELDRLAGEFKNQAASLVVETATKVLGAELKGNHKQLIDESLGRLGRNN
jgi:F-type H+-transporting ATPase subunit b